MKEVAIEDLIDDMIEERTMVGKKAIAVRAKELIVDLQANYDFNSIRINRVEYEKSELESQNKKLIDILYKVVK